MAFWIPESIHSCFFFNFTHSLLLDWNISQVLKSWTTLLSLLKQSGKGSLALPIISSCNKPHPRSDGQSADWLIPWARPLAGEPFHWLSFFTHRWDANTDDLLVKVWRWQRGCSLIWRRRQRVAAADRRLQRPTQLSRFDCVKLLRCHETEDRLKTRKKNLQKSQRDFYPAPWKIRFHARNQPWKSLSFRSFFALTLNRERTSRLTSWAVVEKKRETKGNRHLFTSEPETREVVGQLWRTNGVSVGCKIR